MFIVSSNFTILLKSKAAYMYVPTIYILLRNIHNIWNGNGSSYEELS